MSLQDRDFSRPARSKRTKISAVRLVRGQKEDGRPSDVWSTTEGQLCLKSQIAGHGGLLPRPEVVETIRIWWDPDPLPVSKMERPNAAFSLQRTGCAGFAGYRRH